MKLTAKSIGANFASIEYRKNTLYQQSPIVDKQIQAVFMLQTLRILPW